MGTTSSALLMLFAFLFIERIEFCSSNTNSNVSCIASEQEALIEFRGKLKDDANSLSTLVGKDCCLWKGVSCSRKTGHVMKLDLRNPIPFDSNKGDFIQHSANFDKNRLRRDKSFFTRFKSFELHRLEHEQFFRYAISRILRLSEKLEIP
ncbi:Receptor-like protein EIX2 [Camellia lanceoleosa]|uniref:Receptor-like protein EIX2 n=1 Tax=Camellia lanceoleosa TaxID=1840588 RepID=A0ACC0G4V0_9ERIC|nr:Receptor-like protein EIX2 [Camellia lanceoleosa]